jgi:3-oxoacyl-[acyl-carrier-protein] synthase II
MTNRVAVTGFGAVTPVGNDAETTWRSLVEGRSGIGRITTFDPETFTVKIAGLVKDFELDPDLVDERVSRHLSRVGRFAVAAAAEALRNARVDRDTYEPEERGVTVGGSAGRAELEEFVEMQHVQVESEGRDLYRQAPASVLRRDQQVPAAAMALLADCRGPLVSVSTACTSSAHSIGEGYRRIQDGEAKLMLTGGYDALTTWLDVLGFSLLGALTKDYNDEPERASRPFDGRRSGFVLGEGAVIAVLEDMESARGRGAPILAEIAGYGSSMNAYRMTDPPPDGGGVTLAMRRAIEDSGLPPDEIDYVVAHGTSTPGNDLTETIAIKQVFGDHAYKLAISSPKSMTGHLTGASGALNVLAAANAIREGVVPPTINHEERDPKLDLDYVPNTARELEVDAALVNGFAFGGTNGCLVVRRADANGGGAA